MNFDQLSKKFNKNGYVYIENLFSESLMDAYHEKILYHFASNSKHIHDESFLDKSDTDVIPWLPQLDGEKIFSIVEDDIRLTNLTENILGKGWRSLYSMVMFSIFS